MDNLWIIYGYGWCFFATPVKNMSSSIGMMNFPSEWENIKCSSHHQPVIVCQYVVHHDTSDINVIQSVYHIYIYDNRILFIIYYLLAIEYQSWGWRMEEICISGEIIRNLWVTFAVQYWLNVLRNFCPELVTSNEPPALMFAGCCLRTSQDIGVLDEIKSWHLGRGIIIRVAVFFQCKAFELWNSNPMIVILNHMRMDGEPSQWNTQDGEPSVARPLNN